MSEGRRAHARQIIQSGKQLLIEGDQPRVLVPSLLRLQSKQEKIFLRESEVDVLQVVKRAHEQTGAHQKQKRDCHLHHNQCFTKSRNRASRAAALLE